MRRRVLLHLAPLGIFTVLVALAFWAFITAGVDAINEGAYARALEAQPVFPTPVSRAAAAAPARACTPSQAVASLGDVVTISGTAPAAVTLVVSGPGPFYGTEVFPEHGEPLILPDSSGRYSFPYPVDEELTYPNGGGYVNVTAYSQGAIIEFCRYLTLPPPRTCEMVPNPIVVGNGGSVLWSGMQVLLTSSGYARFKGGIMFIDRPDGYGESQGLAGTPAGSFSRGYTPVVPGEHRVEIWWPTSAGPLELAASCSFNAKATP